MSPSSSSTTPTTTSRNPELRDDDDDASPATTTTKIAVESNHAFPHPPWQFAWKSPQWHGCNIVNDDNTTTTTGTPVQHAAAHIQIPIDVPRQTNPDDDNDNDDNDENAVYMLTVTLATAGHYHAQQHQHHHQEGTDIWMQIWKQPQPSTTTTTTKEANDDKNHNLHAPLTHLSLVASRSLQWPATSMMMLPPTPQQQEQQQSTSKSSTSSSKNHAIHNDASCLVALALARRPPPDALAEWTNALDVLHWLSLDRTAGLTAVQRQWLQHLQQQQKQQQQQPPPPPPEDDDNDTDAPPQATTDKQDQGGELLLLCLDTQHVLHVYKMHDIWQSSSATTTQQSDNDDGMAAFLFGRDLLQQVQTRILPLTQPWQQVRLRVKPDPFLGTLDGPSAAAFANKNVAPATTTTTTTTAPKTAPPRLVAVADLLCLTGSHGSSSSPRGRTTTGVVTFVSLRTMEEVRTVYLPFVPTQLYPWQWHGWIFVLCVGRPDQIDETCAIRVDGATTETTVPAGAAPSLFQVQRTDTAVVMPPLLHVGRFQVVPIVWPRYKQNASPEQQEEEPVTLKMVVGSTGIHCAAVYQSRQCLEVVQYSFGSIDTLPEERLDMVEVYGHYRPPGLTTAGLPALVMRTETVVATFSILPHAKSSSSPSLSPMSTWCHTRQGWGLLGVGREVYWIGWQGQRQAVAFCKHVATLPEDDTHPLVELVQPLDLLPTGPAVASKPASTTRGHPVIASSSTSDPDPSTNIDSVILDAMESISALNYRGSASPPASPLNRLRKALTQQQKSQRLLRQCSDWTRLEASQESTLRLNRVQPVVSLRGKTGQNVLTMRQADMEHAEAAPFEVILSWLVQYDDYFTAASLALDLLKDEASLQHLWESHGKIRPDKVDSYAILEGLLDGVSPLVIDEKKRKPGTKSKSTETLVELADMAIGCLTKGGYRMSSTLEQFVLRDEYYRAARATLILVATAAHTLSSDADSVAIAMGKDYTKTSHEDVDHQAVLWPVRALLNVGVARDMLSVVLLLLNTTIPDTLRNRKDSDLPSAPEPSLSLCKALVSLIVGASPEAAELLLGLTDEQSRVLFWNSLNHETQLELCVVSIGEDSPMLLQPPVRNWVLGQLQENLATEGSAATVDVFEKTPHHWLQELVLSSLRNACCSLKEVRPMVVTSSKDIDSTPSFGAHCDKIDQARALILSAKGQFCVDFDLLIGSLLVLERRGLDWWDGSSLSTQSLLNAACHFAGRRSQKEMVAPLNAPALMRQCFLAGNVQAGANLVGGYNGLVLTCCHILGVAVGMEMDDSERFLLADNIAKEKRSSSGSLSRFVPSEAHFEILWLLREHVLGINVYKHFTSSSSARGHVDPVAAARVCLRTWWRISLETADSTPWLVRWLQEQLEIEENRSPHRLACAALLRALIWPGSEVTQPEMPEPSTFLGSHLRLPHYFVTQLSLSAVGLVESVPRVYLQDVDVSKSNTHLRGSSDNFSGMRRQMSDNISRLSSSSLSVDG